MANLLANPSDWQDSESTSPPVYWNGTTYVWETADPPNLFVLDFTGSASGSDVVSFTISAPGFIAERYLNICSDSEVLASYPLLSPPSTQVDVSATEVSKIVVSSDAGSIFPNTTYEGVLTLSLPFEGPLDDPRHIPQKKTLYCAEGETRLVLQEWAGECEERNTSIDSSAWEFTGSGTVTEQTLSGTRASVILAPNSNGRLKNTVVLANGETLVAWRYVDVNRYR